MMPIHRDGSRFAAALGLFFWPLLALSAVAACGDSKSSDDPASDAGTPTHCEQGASDCPCRPDAPHCDLGVICQSGLCRACVGDHCPVGEVGMPCPRNGRCNDGAICNDKTQHCESCEPGTGGCACDDTQCEGSLSCKAGLCLQPRPIVPKSVRCYTPCKNDLVTADGTRRCDADGLLDGCLDGRKCMEGACVANGDEPASCGRESDCPYFQDCIEGLCLANCASREDCPAGYGCHERVCRVACRASDQRSACPRGEACELLDGDHGYCRVLPAQTDVSAAPPELLRLHVSNDSLSFESKPEASFQISAQSVRSEQVTIRKVQHAVTYANGRTEIAKLADDGTCDASRGECPLYWLKWAVSGQPKTGEALVLDVPPGCTAKSCPAVKLASADETTAVRWTGQLEVSAAGAPPVRVALSYVRDFDGIWAGQMYYFGTFQDSHVDEWLARPDRKDTSDIGNAFLSTWGALRRGALNYGWKEFAAVMRATQTESWRFDEVKARCLQLTKNKDAACFPFDSGSPGLGIATYVDEQSLDPIPSGLIAFPFAMNLRMRGDTMVAGRVDSRVTMHYPGYSAVSFALAKSPNSACSNGDCLVFLDASTKPTPALRSSVGGRYYPEGECAPFFQRRPTPWLLHDFPSGSAGGDRLGCFDTRFGVVPASPELRGYNAAFAAANPVPDGVARARELTFFDGVLVAQNQLFLLFRESFSGFAPERQTDAYGYLLLRRSPELPSVADDDRTGIPDAYEGVPAPTVTSTPALMGGASCDPDLLQTLGLIQASVEQQRKVLTHGSDPGNAPPRDPHRVHALCVDTGTFDGGPNPESPVPCPPQSEVVYFAMNSGAVFSSACSASMTCESAFSGHDDVLEVDPSNVRCGGGTCVPQLATWRAQKQVTSDLYHQCGKVVGDTCAFAPSVECSINRDDLLSGRCFYEPAVGETAVDSLVAETAAAFRYISRFRSSTDSRPGFAPRVCVPGSDLVPYCYDPAVLERLSKRFECLTAMATRAGPSVPAELLETLRASFGTYGPEDNPKDGFEHLYAELLVMLGDEALTSAMASRFDVSGSRSQSFPGSKLELGGSDYTGPVGHELRQLYMATQYYAKVVERLTRLGPDLTTASGVAAFVTPSTVTRFVNRVIRASSQKARAWGEIALRYRDLNHRDLAATVVEREYVATYLESVLLTDLMGTVLSAPSLSPTQKDDVRVVIDRAQRTYRDALLQMREVYSRIQENGTLFGFPVDYIPFPALDSGNVYDTNGFEVMARIADAKIADAREREETAIEQGRAFESSRAEFESELVSLQNSHESQLADLCGTFETPQGPKPAITKYADSTGATRLLGNPCGLMGNGQIYEAMLRIDQQRIAFSSQKYNFDKTLARIDNAEAQMTAQCAAIKDYADVITSNGEQVRTLRAEIGAMSRAMEAENATATALGQIMNGLGAAAATASSGLFGVAGAAVQLVGTGVEGAANFMNLTNTLQVNARIAGIEYGACANEKVKLDAHGLVAGTVGTLAGVVSGSGAVSELVDDAAGKAMVIDVNPECNDRRSVHELEQGVQVAYTNLMCEQAKIDALATVKDLLLELRTYELEAMRASLEQKLAGAEWLRLVNEARRVADQQAETEQMAIDIEAARNNPNVRIYRNDAVVNADIFFYDALQAAYKATRVFEYYTSQSYAAMDELFLVRMASRGVPNLAAYMVKLKEAFFDFEEDFGIPDTRVHIVSLRDDILKVSALGTKGEARNQAERGEDFAKLLRDPARLDENGYVTLPFNIQVEALPTLTRNHKLVYVGADMMLSASKDLVARVYLRMKGTGIIRNVNDELDYFVFGSRTAVLNASINGERGAFPPEYYRTGRFRDRPLANTQWELVLNLRDEKANSDVKLENLTDIKLYFYYTDFTAL